MPGRLSAVLFVLAAASLACRRGGLPVVPNDTEAPPPATASESTEAPDASVEPPPSETGHYNAGLRVAQAEYTTPGGRSERLTMAVWYPAGEPDRLHAYEVEETYTSHVAFEAPPADDGGPFPLVIYAHGAFSSGYSLAFFGEHLARHGYVVVAPDYIDTFPPDFTESIAFSRIEGGRADPSLRVFAAAREWVDVMNADPQLLLDYLAEHRLGQTSYVLDQALVWNADPASDLYQRIDPARVGIVGWSLGGSTALGLAGAHPDPAARDVRIRAALLLSAPAYPFQESLGQIGVPIMLMEGDRDEPGAGPEFPRRMIYTEAPAPKYHLVLDATTHYDFGNRPAGRRPLDEAVAEVPALNAIASYGLAFFDAYLRQDALAVARLDGNHPALDLYEEQE